MKIKKSKIVVPALGLLLLSTAASVTGSVAWFTANRTFKMTAGDFAVVNTKNNLQATLAAGIGTSVAAGTYTVNIADSAYSLTDASFDHNSTTFNVVEPDDDGTAVGETIALGNAIVNNDTSVANNVLRETNIYSIFTWDITFKILFSGNASKDIGLYFNIGNSLARESFAATGPTDNYQPGTWYTTMDCTEPATPTAANFHQYVAKGGEDGSEWYTTSACSGEHPVTLTKGSTYYRPGYAVGSYYQAAPDDTGKGFRLAFVPKNIPGSSEGYTRIWAPHQTSANVHYIDTSKAAVSAYSNSATYAVGAYVIQGGKYYRCTTAVESAEAFNPAKWTVSSELEYRQANFDTNTTKMTAGTTVTNNVAAGSAIAYSGGEYTVPGESGEAKATALARPNYLGFFAKDPNTTVQLTYTCVAYYEGTDPTIVNTASTIYETMATSLEFTAISLTD